ncbi:hypothetical protein [Paeniglutamicibacter kerguelensis]|uniref:Uncharacterized protein n=1 Tax=Paeniglutamicibacter kerguelensis TaxID=254788 RepID=A0ABS4XA08_9MICC|nr:hypothetical protein [Paeniglutamicibacter kerguelensis]MBP2385088.1 hypothetical protein [Paeniglutamicibacter kerguelensis]
MINYGFEDVSNPATDWALQSSLLASAGITGVALSVGRVEWSAFVQRSIPGAYPDSIVQEGSDLVKSAIETLKNSGFTGEIVLSVDALTPLILKAQPELAGMDAKGYPSAVFASAWALTRGPVGDGLLDFVSEVAQRYKPTMIGLTELMIAEHSYGNRDLALYTQATGSARWPVTKEGDLDQAHPSLGMWRSLEMAKLISRLKSAVRQHGVELEVDVRSPDPSQMRGRPDSGHDYAMLLDVADRLAVWHYVGIDEHSRGFSEEYRGSLKKFKTHQLVLSVGLWAENGTLSNQELDETLQKCKDIPQLSVTPASLLTEGHWKVLQKHRPKASEGQ